MNPKDFLPSDVNIDDNTIRIIDHGFKSGDKVIYTIDNSNSTELEDNGIYYIVVFDKDTFRLSETNENSTKTNYISINFSSNFGGTINPINPPIYNYIINKSN